MRNRYVTINNSIFDRQTLVEGYTSSNIYIPDGGVIINENTLVGFINNSKELIIVGNILGSIYNIPKYSEKDIPKYSEKDIPKYSEKDITNDNSKSPIDNTKIELAINIFKKYYRQNFN